MVIELNEQQRARHAAHNRKGCRALRAAVQSSRLELVPARYEPDFESEENFAHVALASPGDRAVFVALLRREAALHPWRTKLDFRLIRLAASELFQVWQYERVLAAVAPLPGGKKLVRSLEAGIRAGQEAHRLLVSSLRL